MRRLFFLGFLIGLFAACTKTDMEPTSEPSLTATQRLRADLIGRWLESYPSTIVEDTLVFTEQGFFSSSYTSDSLFEVSQKDSFVLVRPLYYLDPVTQTYVTDTIRTGYPVFFNQDKTLIHVFCLRKDAFSQCLSATYERIE